jgi:uncharacterized protein YcfJ
MKLRAITAAVLAVAGTSATAMDFTDTAPVVSVTPIVERVLEPRQECATVQGAPAQPQERSMAGAVVGGAAGGLLGAQVGKGNGRTAAAAAGAIAGAIIGDRIDNSNRQTASAPQQQCRTVETTREIVRGYNVVYRYNDRDIATTLPYDPGRTVTVGVGVIDNRRDASASMMGGNVREVQAPPPAPVPVNAPARGNYTYRY